MFVGAGVFVGVMVQRVRSLVAVETQFVRRTTGSGGQGDGMEASWHRQGGAEHTGHQLVGWVSMDGCTVGVAVVISPAVLCGKSENSLLKCYSYIKVPMFHFHNVKK